MIIRCILLFLIQFYSLLNYAESCHTTREVFLENKETKVWKTTLCPHELLAYHNHLYPRVVIPLTDGTLDVIYKSGKKDRVHLVKENPTYLDYAQGKELHQDINNGNEPVTVIVIELRK